MNTGPNVRRLNPLRSFFIVRFSSLLVVFCAVVSLIVQNRSYLSQVECEKVLDRFDERAQTQAGVARVARACAEPGSETYRTAYRRELVAWYRAGQYRRVLDEAARVLRRNEPRDSVLVTMVSEYAGLSSYYLDELDDGERHFRRALRYTEPTSAARRVGLITAYVSLLRRQKRYWDAKVQMQNALQIAESAPLSRWKRATLYVAASGVRLDARIHGWGERAQDVESIRRAESFLNAHSFGDTHLRALLDIQKGGFALFEGATDRAEQWVQRALDSKASPRIRTAAHLMQARIDTTRRDLDGALASLATAEQTAREGGRDLLGEIQAFRVEMYAQRGDYVRAYQTLVGMAGLCAPGASVTRRRAERIYLARVTGAAQHAWPWIPAVCLLMGAIALVSVGYSIPAVRQRVDAWVGWQRAEREDDDRRGSTEEGAEASDAETRGPASSDASWTLHGDAGGGLPESIDVVPRLPEAWSPEHWTPDRLAPQIPTGRRPVPRLSRPVVAVERYRPDGTPGDLVGVPSSFFEEMIRRHVFVLDLGATHRIVLRLNEGTRTVLRSATRNGVKWQTLPVTVLGLPLYDLPSRETQSGDD